MKRAGIPVLCFPLLLLSCGFFLHDVEYRVSGSAATVDLTWTGQDHHTSTAPGTPLPWTYSFVGQYKDPLFLSAQTGAGGGSVTVEILLNGRVRTSSTNSGAFVFATAEAYVGDN